MVGGLAVEAGVGQHAAVLVVGGVENLEELAWRQPAAELVGAQGGVGDAGAALDLTQRFVSPCGPQRPSEMVGGLVRVGRRCRVRVAHRAPSQPRVTALVGRQRSVTSWRSNAGLRAGAAG